MGEGYTVDFGYRLPTDRERGYLANRRQKEVKTLGASEEIVPQRPMSIFLGNCGNLLVFGEVPTHSDLVAAGLLDPLVVDQVSPGQPVGQAP